MTQNLICEVLADATLVSTWNDGIIIETPCKFNVTTDEVMDIGQSDECPSCGLESQCVIYVDGEGWSHFFEVDKKGSFDQNQIM